MSTCLKAQILWDADNAKRFGKLCRRTMGLCEEGPPCRTTPAEGWILLVSSQRGLTSLASETDSAEIAHPQA